jgi:hypothetical protein
MRAFSPRRGGGRVLRSVRATKTANPGTVRRQTQRNWNLRFQRRRRPGGPRTVRQLACRNGIEISDFDAVGGVGISEARRRCRASTRSHHLCIHVRRLNGHPLRSDSLGVVFCRRRRCRCSISSTSGDGGCCRGQGSLRKAPSRSRRSQRGPIALGRWLESAISR